MANINFTPDKAEADSMGAYTPLPKGKYEVMIVASELRDTRAGDGSYLSLQYTILSGDQTNRTLYQNYNIKNPNPMAVSLAHKALSALCFACGKGESVPDSEDLHNIPLMVDVVISRDGKNNDIKSYSKSNNAVSVQPAQEFVPVPPVGASTVDFAPDDSTPF